MVNWKVFGTKWSWRNACIWKVFGTKWSWRNACICIDVWRKTTENVRIATFTAGIQFVECHRHAQCAVCGQATRPADPLITRTKLHCI